MLYFSVNAIDNSWYAPLAWFPISSTTCVTKFILSKMSEIFERLQKYDLSLVCGCADGEINAPHIQREMRKQQKIPTFVFVNDFVHNFKNQRNVLFSALIMDSKVSMSKLIDIMIANPVLYNLLDREEVSPSDIMALKPCLNLTNPNVINVLLNIDTNEAKHLAKYLKLIRETYDAINNNSENLKTILQNSITQFQQLNNYPRKTLEICLHTLEGLIQLSELFPNFKPSCISINANELVFSIVRGKYPRPTVKQFCSCILVTFYIFLVMHVSDEVRGFSLPKCQLTNHYNGMSLELKELPPLSEHVTSKHAKIDSEELEAINNNIEIHARKSTLRLETCAPKRIYLCCPIPGCCHLKPYIRKGQFLNHLKAVHNKTNEEAEILVRECECKHFRAQMERDFEERKRSLKANAKTTVGNPQSSQDERTRTSQEEIEISEQEEIQTEKEVCVHSFVKGDIVVNQTFEGHTNPSYPYNKSKYNIFIMDLETTGFSLSDDIIQYAFLSLTSGSLVSTFIKPKKPIHLWNDKVWGLHKEKYLQQSRWNEEQLPSIYSYITSNESCDVILLVHCNKNGLDQTFFENNLRQCNIQPKKKIHYVFTYHNKWIPGKLEHAYKTNFQDHSPGPHHDASVDVVMVFDLLMRRFNDEKYIIKKCFDALGLRQTSLLDYSTKKL